ncbi:hypothetical protein D3C73_656530 [compost metagenome]
MAQLVGVQAQFGSRVFGHQLIVASLLGQLLGETEHGDCLARAGLGEFQVRAHETPAHLVLVGQIPVVFHQGSFTVARGTEHLVARTIELGQVGVIRRGVLRVGIVAAVFAGPMGTGKVIALLPLAVGQQQIRDLIARGESEHLRVVIEVECIVMALGARHRLRNVDVVVAAQRRAGNTAVILAEVAVGIDLRLDGIARRLGLELDAEIVAFGNDVARFDGANVDRAAHSAFDVAAQ